MATKQNRIVAPMNSIADCNIAETSQPQQSPSNQKTNPYVSPGMPTLASNSARVVSAFEFWPMWLMYLPVVVQWLGLGVWHRSLTLPLLANPNLPISGMVGVPKSQLFRQAQGQCAARILPWFLHKVSNSDTPQQVQAVVEIMSAKRWSFPVVCKPDIGCRGSGVKLINSELELHRCIANYSVDSGILIQKLATWEPEAGVFYAREPQQEKGRIISLALKYMPYVVGDGESTLSELIAQDERASQLQHLYQQRHKNNWHNVLPAGQPYRLVFSASHCRGAIFRDGNHLITEALTGSIDALMQEIPEFHYGRLDIKFADVEQLQQGQKIEIVEINAASSEALHIWDKDTALLSALSALLKQYRLLFRIGAQNRRRGFKPPTLTELLQRWRLERRLTAYHPETD